MATIKDQIIRGHSAKLTSSGWEIVEVRVVSLENLETKDGFGNVDGWGVMMDIVENDMLPQIGKGHEARPDALLREIDPNPVSNGDIEITYVYRENRHNITKVSISSNAQEVETNRGRRVQVDTNGNVGGTPLFTSRQDMDVSYDYPTDHPDAKYAGKQGDVTKTGHLSTTLIPNTTVTITRDELTNHVDIVQKSLTYVGILNNAPFKFVEGSELYVWKCMDISGDSTENNVALTENQWYQVRYVFEYVGVGPDQRGFKKIVYIDPTTGKPPKDLKWELDSDKDLASQKYYLVDFALDFGELNLLGEASQNQP